MPFFDIAGRVAEVRGQIEQAAGRGGHGQQVRIVAVTKTQPVEAVKAVCASGISDVGENKVQEALTKQAGVGAGARWHLIGHLQRNKVRHLSSFHLFHALDSARLADAIESHFGVRGERVRALMQVNIAEEETKGGYSFSELETEAARLRSLKGLTVEGVMTMAPFGADEAELRRVFSGARKARDILRAAGHEAVELSMGMSQDFAVAVEEGATMVRLGTILFGERTT
jgi:pyridoxal phosphate enzyme (YggS family)